MAFTIAKDTRGDFVSHRAGCKDLTNGRHVQQDRWDPPNTYRGADMVEAIKAADKAMAGWFVLEPYDRDAEETAWTFGHTAVAPCLKPMLKGIVLDPETGEPSWATKKGTN